MNPSVLSFSDGSRKLPVNHRINATMAADSTRRKTNLPTVDNNGLVYFLSGYYGREEIFHPEILAKINPGDIATPEEEISRLMVLPANASSADRQCAIYRIALAKLGQTVQLPSAKPNFAN